MTKPFSCKLDRIMSKFLTLQVLPWTQCLSEIRAPSRSSCPASRDWNPPLGSRNGNRLTWPMPRRGPVRGHQSSPRRRAFFSLRPQGRGFIAPHGRRSHFPKGIGSKPRSWVLVWKKETIPVETGSSRSGKFQTTNSKSQATGENKKRSKPMLCHCQGRNLYFTLANQERRLPFAGGNHTRRERANRE